MGSKREQAPLAKEWSLQVTVAGLHAGWDAEQRGWLGRAAWESGRAQTRQLKLGLLSPRGSPAPMKSWNYAKTAGKKYPTEIKTALITVCETSVRFLGARNSPQGMDSP